MSLNKSLDSTRLNFRLQFRTDGLKPRKQWIAVASHHPLHSSQPYQLSLLKAKISVSLSAKSIEWMSSGQQMRYTTILEKAEASTTVKVIPVAAANVTAQAVASYRFDLAKPFATFAAG